MQHKKLEHYNNILTIPASDFRCLYFPINTTGKINHSVTIQFSVRQGGENTTSKIRAWSFTSLDHSLWTVMNTYTSLKKFITKRKNKKWQYAIENKQSKIKFDMIQDDILFVVLANDYMATIDKYVTLSVIEEWDIEDLLLFDVIPNLPSTDLSLKTKIKKMIRGSKRSLSIISPYIDMLMINDLIVQKNKGVKIKIITRNNDRITGSAKKGLAEIRKNFPNGVILANDIHARLIIRDNVETLISSSDLTRDSLHEQKNLGIKTTDINAVNYSRMFFDRIWNESKLKGNVDNDS